MIGSKLGNYTIEREIGRGGMGAVYVGTHALLGRKAAIKVLLPAMSRDEVVQRFFNEAKAATSIKHPGIIEVFDYGTAGDGSAFIVMELLEGESLARRLERAGPVSSELAIAFAKQIASALAAAHRAGIVHRDLKPDNVFLVADPDVQLGERIKLLDFGIAKLVSADGKLDMALTHTGALMGTPYYMSPEQCRGAALVDARSDLYSLGCMLFEMVTGRVPFVGEGLGEIIGAHIHVAPASPRSLAPALAPALEQVILHLLAKSPGDRPASADALVDELTSLGPGARAPARGSGRPPLAAAVDSRAATVAEHSGGTNPTASERAAWPAASLPARPRPLLFVGGLAVVAASAVFVAVRSRPDDEPRAVAQAAADASLVDQSDAASVAMEPPADAGAIADAALIPDAAIVRHTDRPARTTAGPGLGSYDRQKDANRNKAVSGGPSWPQPAPPRWKAVFTFSAVTSSDSSELAQIQRDFDARKSGIEYCYDDRRLHDHRPTSETVSITVTIPPAREYPVAKVRGKEEITTSCVRAVLQGSTWSPLHTDTPVVVRTSFTVQITD